MQIVIETESSIGRGSQFVAVLKLPWAELNWGQSWTQALCYWLRSCRLTQGFVYLFKCRRKNESWNAHAKVFLSCVCRPVRDFAHWDTGLKLTLVFHHTHAQCHLVLICATTAQVAFLCMCRELSLEVTAVPWVTEASSHVLVQLQPHRLQASTPLTWQSCRFHTGRRAWNKAHENRVGC